MKKKVTHFLILLILLLHGEIISMAQTTVVETTDVFWSDGFTAGVACPTQFMTSDYVSLSDNTTPVNYVGTTIPPYDENLAEAAMKFTLPASAATLSSVKLRLKVKDRSGSPTTTITLTDDNNWQQTTSSATSKFPTLTNAVTLVSNQSVSSTGWIEISLPVSYIAAKISSSSSSIITLIVTGSTTASTYFSFVADDNGIDMAELVLAFSPSITTQAVSDIISYTATGNGNITDLGTSNPTAYGVCWNTTGTPTTSDSKIDKGTVSTTGAFTASMTSLSANTTYYVRAFATNSAGTSYGNEVSFTTLEAGTWTGLANSSYWTDAGNWSDNKVPTATTNVTIPAFPLGGYLPMIYSGDAVECNNLTTAPGYLEIQSSSSGYGSLIVHGTESGSVQTDIYLPKDEWHVVAPACEGYNISDFLTNGSNDSYIGKYTKNGTTYYDMRDFNETSDSWNDCFTSSTSGSLTGGTGYAMQTADNSYILMNFGSLVTGTRTVTLTKQGNGWNCIGNPYTSAIDLNSSSTNKSFLYYNTVSNTGILDDSYNALYTWDVSSGHYKAICRENFDSYFTQNYAVPNEGFFVKAATDGAEISFTPDMQTLTTTAAATSIWPVIAVKLANSSKSGTTVVAFNSAMTKGLDKGYDAGFLADSSGLNIYSRLVSDNGVDFTIQSLPVSTNDQIVPLTVECKNGGDITFSAQTANLTSSIYALLEDKLTGTVTDLKSGNTYTVSVAADSKISNRFYLHTAQIAPTAVTNSPSSISSNAATLNGTVNAYGVSTTVTFEYGTTTSYGSSATSAQSPVTSTSAVSASAALSGLTPNTTYHYRVKAENTAGTIYGADSTFITSISDVTWNGSWSPSEPTASNNAIINADYNTSGISCKNLTINSGFQVTFTSDVTVAGNLLVKSGATLINEGTISVTGTTTVQQDLTGAGTTTPSGRFWYVASPVTGATSTTFGAAGDNRLWNYDESAHAYSEIISNTTTLTAGTGYVARLGADQTVSFTGTLTSGDVTLEPSRTGTSDAKRGYNLIGNPYLSYLDWNAAYASASNMLPTIWYRTVNASGTMLFDTYSALGVGTNNNGFGAVTGYIPPMQAVWVKVDGDGKTGALSFTNAMRSHQSGSLKEDVAYPVVRLAVSNGTNTDEAIAVFADSASNGFDKFDSPKMSNNNVHVPELYMQADSEKVAINGLKPFEGTDSISFGFRSFERDTFSVSLGQFDGFDGYQAILIDNITKDSVVLNNADYSFVADSGDNTSRFTLVLKATTETTGISPVTQSGITIKTAGSAIVVSSDVLPATISVSDVLGRTVLSSEAATSSASIEVPVSGVYFVTVTAGNSKETVKVVINK